jgi:hypothetical protein
VILVDANILLHAEDSLSPRTHKDYAMTPFGP